MNLARDTSDVLSPERLAKYCTIQNIAKSVLAELASSIHSGDTERTLSNRANDLLHSHGITETWYHDCPALVLSGSRSRLSISGRDYVPADEPVGDFNFVTIDLSPCRDGIWGDCARSFAVENGLFAPAPTSEEMILGMAMEERLHAELVSIAQPEMPFEELFNRLNASIHDAGYQNLDFRNNLGHSIVSDLAKRTYMTEGNHTKLKDVLLFTFEPHICRTGGNWGFKFENIYYFDDNSVLNEL